ncbi:MAG: gliding motility-associated lipoprotein GldH [Flavobacteriales bacterium]|jgi:gliding motility-associated lipoprotein GldH
MRSWVLVLMAMALSSCGPEAVYQKMSAIPNSEWIKEAAFSHEVDMTDETGLIDMNLEIRHVGNYPYSNLFVFLRSEFPDGKVRVDTIECLLARPTGEWYGSGLGDLYSLSIPFRKNVQFNQKGVYKMELSHGMRQDTLEGIADIGITFYQSEARQNLTSQQQ